MSTKTRTQAQRLREYDRDMLRSSFVSVFWAAITERRKLGKYPLQSLADKLNIGKSSVSRWFSDDAPNWQLDTVADIASALNLDIHITAVDRKTGTIITPSGAQNIEVQRAKYAETETPSSSLKMIKAPPTPPQTEADVS